MKVIFRIILFISIVCLFSCEELDSIVKCSECTLEEPQSADLIIKIRYFNGGSYGLAPVTIRIYEGNLEDDILKASFSTTSEETSYTVSLNKTYTVTATYDLNGDIYIAVDSAIPGVRYIKDQCDEPCYYVYDRILNLGLKYTAE